MRNTLDGLFEQGEVHGSPAGKGPLRTFIASFMISAPERVGARGPHAARPRGPWRIRTGDPKRSTGLLNETAS